MTFTRPTNPYAEAYASFCEQTANHRLVVLQDDGLYRHLRVQAPGTRMWSWDVITWPGHLATSGDVADGHVFAREPDMLEFFSLTSRSNGYYSDGAPSIDVRYWAEKLCGRRAHEIEKYDPDSFLRQVHEHLGDHENLGDTDVAMTSPAQQRDAILEDAKWQGSSESEAHRWLSEHPELFGEDTWEWDLREYDIHFLFTCYCIAFTARLWNEHVSEQKARPVSEH